jgi:hypothetical protein
MKKVTAEVIEKNRYLVTVEVEDNATDGDIYDAIVRAYIGDDTYMGDSCKVIEQFIYDVTNIKVKEKMIKEYKWIGNTYMTNLMIDVNKDACKGWRLVNIVHNGGYFAAVLERDKILNGEENE